jgi:cbb3-type cytochrome oxidase subunit 3
MIEVSFVSTLFDNIGIEAALLFFSFLLLIFLICFVFHKKKRSSIDYQSIVSENDKLKKDIDDLKHRLSQSINDFDNLKRSSSDIISKKDNIIDDLRMKMFDYKQNRKAAEEMDSDEKPRIALQKLQEKYQAFDNKEYTGYSISDIDYMLERIRFLEDELSKNEHSNISEVRKVTWKGLNGDRFGTLSYNQRSLVHFPRFNPNCLYYLPHHNTFHAVFWCYSLDFSPNPLQITLIEAMKKNLKPCSKCVDEEHYEQYSKSIEKE